MIVTVIETRWVNLFKIHDSDQIGVEAFSCRSHAIDQLAEDAYPGHWTYLGSVEVHEPLIDLRLHCPPFEPEGRYPEQRAEIMAWKRFGMEAE